MTRTETVITFNNLPSQSQIIDFAVANTDGWWTQFEVPASYEGVVSIARNGILLNIQGYGMEKVKNIISGINGSLIITERISIGIIEGWSF
jgi:hypothetical protein